MGINFGLLIGKLAKAIQIKHGVVLLYSTKQKVSEKSGRVYTEHSLELSMTTEEYNEMFPNQKLNPNIHKSKYASLLLIKTVRQDELFKYLLDEIWKKLESGEMYEKGKQEREKIRSRYYPRRRKRRSGSEGVLQDAPVGEELPGGISGDEQRHGQRSLQGDTGEA